MNYFQLGVVTSADSFNLVVIIIEVPCAGFDMVLFRVIGVRVVFESYFNDSVDE